MKYIMRLFGWRIHMTHWMRTVIISLSIISAAGSALATVRTGIGAPVTLTTCNLTTYISKNRLTSCISLSYGFPINYLSSTPQVLNGAVVITPHLALRWFAVDLLFWFFPSFVVIWLSAVFGHRVLREVHTWRGER